MNLLLDTGILGQLCHPAKPEFRPVLEWVEAILNSGSGDRIFLPELCDYELRRKLLHLVQKGQSTERSVQRLNELGTLFEYLPIDTATLRKAAEFWSDSRLRGQPTAPEKALDGDVILAAQAALIGGTIVTTNRKHLSQFVPARDRSEFYWVYPFVCIRGRLDNLVFEWDDSFIVEDSQCRIWHCRQETTCVFHEEVDLERMDSKFLNVIDDLKQMGSRQQEPAQDCGDTTTFSGSVFVGPTPQSESSLREKLVEILGKTTEQ